MKNKNLWVYLSFLALMAVWVIAPSLMNDDRWGFVVMLVFLGILAVINRNEF